MHGSYVGNCLNENLSKLPIVGDSIFQFDEEEIEQLSCSSGDDNINSSHSEQQSESSSNSSQDDSSGDEMMDVIMPPIVNNESDNMIPDEVLEENAMNNDYILDTVEERLDIIIYLSSNIYLLFIFFNSKIESDITKESKSLNICQNIRKQLYSK